MTLRVIFIAAILFAASAPATAQVPTFKVYTDPSLSDPWYHCGTPGTTSEVFVVLSNANFVVSAVDFHIDFPNWVVWLADVPPDGSYDNTWVRIGNSPTGIAIAWANCCMVDGRQGPFVVMRALVFWVSGCSDGPLSFLCLPFVVGGASPGKTAPSVVRSGDFQEFTGEGYSTYSDLCRPNPVAPTTWGKVKSLYR